MDCVLFGIIASSSRSYQFKEAWEVEGEQLGGPPGRRLITVKRVGWGASVSWERGVIYKMFKLQLKIFYFSIFMINVYKQIQFRVKTEFLKLLISNVFFQIMLFPCNSLVNWVLINDNQINNKLYVINQINSHAKVVTLFDRLK